MQRAENISQDNRIKRGKDEDRFYCPYPGCTRSFAELWRLKVHYRAPPDVRGSGKERGHGTELQFCPKCGKELRPGKHHVGCFAGRAGVRQPAKRPRDAEADTERKDEPDTPTESARQRTRTSTLHEDILPRTSSLSRFSDEAASLTRSGWHGEQAAQVKTEELALQHLPMDNDLLAPKPADQLSSYQQMLSSQQRNPRTLLSLTSRAPSPPPSPPGDLDPELANMPPLFDFSLFNPDRAKGRNARLPVAVTSTLHSPPDESVLQAILGDATSFAAGANQLGPAAADHQQLMAQQRIQQVAASAQELLRVQGPSFPHSSSHPAPQGYDPFPSPPPHLPTTFGDLSRGNALASLLQQPNQLISSMEHYEAPGSGRPGRTHGQQQSRYQPLSSGTGWTHKPVARRQPGYGGSGLTPLPSPPALINTQQPATTPGSSFPGLLSWEFNNRWGLPNDNEGTAAQSMRLRDQQQHQQQLQLTQQSPALLHQRNAESALFRPLISDPTHQSPHSLGSVHSGGQLTDPQRGWNQQQQLGPRLSYNVPHATTAVPQGDHFSFPEPCSADESEAFLAYSRRLSRQAGPGQEPMQDRQPQLPWGLQDAAGLFEQFEGISPEPSATYGTSSSDLGPGMPMHGHYFTDEPMHTGLPSRLSSSEPQANSLSGWNMGHSGERSLLEHIGQASQQTSDRSQAGSQSSLLPYDDRLWGRSAGHMPQDQEHRTG